MTCTWCTTDAITIGRAPVGTLGRTDLPSCNTHMETLKKLGYTPMSESEFRKARKREEKEAKR